MYIIKVFSSLPYKPGFIWLTSNLFTVKAAVGYMLNVNNTFLSFIGRVCAHSINFQKNIFVFFHHFVGKTPNVYNWKFMISMNISEGSELFPLKKKLSNTSYNSKIKSTNLALINVHFHRDVFVPVIDILIAYLSHCASQGNIHQEQTRAVC